MPKVVRSAEYWKEYMRAWKRKEYHAKKEIMRARNKKWREENKEHVRKRSKEWYEKNKERYDAYQERYYQENIEKFKAYDKERHQQKLRCQEILAIRPRPDRCEICEEVGKVVWDHCHITGLFRGWLCARCNRFLSWHERFFEQATNYLVRFENGRSEGLYNEIQLRGVSYFKEFRKQ